MSGERRTPEKSARPSRARTVGRAPRTATPGSRAVRIVSTWRRELRAFAAAAGRRSDGDFDGEACGARRSDVRHARRRGAAPRAGRHSDRAFAAAAARDAAACSRSGVRRVDRARERDARGRWSRRTRRAAAAFRATVLGAAARVSGATRGQLGRRRNSGPELDQRAPARREDEQCEQRERLRAVHGSRPG